jgi:predicted metal-binding membrane protein
VIEAAPGQHRQPLAAGSLLPASALLGVAAAAWVVMLGSSRTMEMSMPGAAASAAQAAGFTLAWGVMMTAMMLPSAAPMFLLYRTVSRRLSASGDRVAPTWAFAGVYLLIWSLLGLPVYAGYVGTAVLRARWEGFQVAAPYAVALVLIGAGLYQLTALKHACLRHCESPLGFLMRRWRSGYRSTLRLAARHAAYCVGCCWALMIVLVAAGAMSLGSVVIITLVVVVEKTVPGGRRAATAFGVALIALGVAVAARPDLERILRGEHGPPAAEMRHH